MSSAKPNTENNGADGPLCRIVLEYIARVKQLVDLAKQPGFKAAEWAPLSNLVAVDEFERVGNFKEVMGWPKYIEFLGRWAASAEWESSFKRIHQWSNMVFLELEERSAAGDKRTVINSLTVYEFNEANKLRHLDIYLQGVF